MSTRAGLTLGLSLGALALSICGWLFGGLYVSMGECGDGTPSSDTPQGHLCDRLAAGDLSRWDDVMLFGPAVFLLAGTLLMILWTYRKAPLWVALPVLALAPLTPPVETYLITTPSDECSPARQATYDEWREEDGRGSPPYWC